MRKLNYYQPIIRPVAKNGSEKLGVHAVTQMWEPEKPRRKMELSVSGNNSKEAIEKLHNSLKSSDNSEVIELPCNYFLCSESVVAHFKPFEVSKPFKSGYDWDKENYYVAWLNFEECEKFYKEVLNEETDFWLWECVPGTMDVSDILITYARKNGLFAEIENHLSITKEKNRAMVIKNLSNQYGYNPVELINKYL